MLSQCTWTKDECQYGPHVAIAKMIGSSSFVWIGVSFHSSCHGHWIHCFCSNQKPPHPHLPEASVVSVAFGSCAGAIVCIMVRPFHDFKNKRHQVRSERNSPVRWIQWSSFLAWFAVSIILLRKMRPGTTLMEEKEVRYPYVTLTAVSDQCIGTLNQRKVKRGYMNDQEWVKG